MEYREEEEKLLTLQLKKYLFHYIIYRILTYFHILKFWHIIKLIHTHFNRGQFTEGLGCQTYEFCFYLSTWGTHSRNSTRFAY